MAGDCTELRVSDLSDLDVNFDVITNGYLPVTVRSLFSQKSVPCDIFSLRNKRKERIVHMGRLLQKGKIYESALHRLLMDHGIQELFIRCEDSGLFTDYFSSNAQEILESPGVLPQRKAELLYDQAEYIVRRVFQERTTRANIAAGKQLVNQISAHALGDQVTMRAMFSLFSKDYYTFTHSVQVSVLGMSFCRFLGLKTEEVDDFGMGALFHDIGKSAIDERILNKPGKLDKEDFDLIKRHPVLGYEQIRATQVMSKQQLEIVLHHHEAMDGSGYPHRLKDSHIHKYARIARIVDIYDALTTKRAYKEALPVVEALRIMSEEMRQTLDLRAFGAFIKFIHAEGKLAAAGSGAA